MNRLKDMMFYLSGPIDDVEDSTTWRDSMSEFLLSIGSGVLNPLNKPFDFALEDNVRERHKLKLEGKYDDVKEIMKPIAAADLHLVHISNSVILYINREAHMCGSYIEAAWAALEKKPVIIMCEQGKVGVPDFLFGLCPHQMFFGSWGEVKDYLLHIDRDDNVEHLKRWRFVDFGKVFNV